jgi:hypothetical protein
LLRGVKDSTKSENIHWKLFAIVEKMRRSECERMQVMDIQGCKKEEHQAPFAEIKADAATRGGKLKW